LNESADDFNYGNSKRSRSASDLHRGTHQYHHLPRYEAIVLKAREMHLAGATVLRGPMGFGKSSRLHVVTRFKISTDLPVVIEFVDSREKIEAFLPIVDTMMDSGLVTLERAEVINYIPDPSESRRPRFWEW
jgi:uncharacterized protein